MSCHASYRARAHADRSSPHRRQRTRSDAPSFTRTTRVSSTPGIADDHPPRLEHQSRTSQPRVVSAPPSRPYAAGLGRMRPRPDRRARRARRRDRQCAMRMAMPLAGRPISAPILARRRRPSGARSKSAGCRCGPRSPRHSITPAAAPSSVVGSWRRAIICRIPNLFSARPVEILAWVPRIDVGIDRGTRRGRGRGPAPASHLPFSVAASGSDSRLNWKMSALQRIAAISSAVLPTPDKHDAIRRDPRRERARHLARSRRRRRRARPWPASPAPRALGLALTA